MPTSWPEAPRDEPVPTAWPEAPRIEPASGSWPEAPRPSGNAPSRPEPPPARDPLPAWSNLSSPAPWPPRQDPLPGTPAPDPLASSYGSASGTHPGPNQPNGGMPGAQPGFDPLTGDLSASRVRDPLAGVPGLDPMSAPGRPDPLGGPAEHTVALGAHAAQQAAQQQAPPQQAPPQQAPPQQGAPQEAQGEARPGSNLSRDPSDPDHRFVTAGQISGSRTPPPERQQELWDNVFGDEYEGMGDDGPGKPVWLYALAGSVAIALVAALLWAFLAGPLASEPATTAASEPSTSAPAGKPTAKKPSVGRLPRFPGDPSPVTGVLADPDAGISIPRLGGPWKADVRTTMKSTYGYSTRQFAPAGTDAAGKPVVAQIMTGPLPAKLAGSFTSPENLEPVIKAVVVSARKLYFSTPNTAKKTATQALKVGGLPAQLNAYDVTVDGVKTTVVAAAVTTGADVPAIVYMSVPAEHKELLPDVNSVFKQIKVTAAS
ncbi:hypothetical protein H4W81_000744 [Nonomuraea africana]|uniref:Uncharacterized protein n=1 Tax=Nonomuraea africana TaxID=46171 RepID=A0ABR9K7T9_9ACTN|nr:hypothetical protein [Nonomuraea africana]